MVPSTAACSGVFPSSWCLNIFSAITIPSSTSIPITTIIPNNDIKLIVISNSPAKISIPKKDIGKPNATQNASLIFKNKERNIRTSKIPKPPFSSNRFVLCLKAIE